MEFVWIDNGCEYQPNKTEIGRFNVWKGSHSDIGPIVYRHSLLSFLREHRTEWFLGPLFFKLPMLILLPIPQFLGADAEQVPKQQLQEPTSLLHREGR